MATTPAKRACPECGMLLPEEAEFCPVCALRQAVETQSDLGTDTCCELRFERYTVLQNPEGKPFELGRGAIQQGTPADSRCRQIASAIASSLLEWLMNAFAAGTESLRVSRAPRTAQTGHRALSSSGSSVPHSGQARLAGVVATVCSWPPGSYSILPGVAREKNRLMKAVRLKEALQATIRPLL